MVLFCHNITPRLLFITEFIGKELLEKPFRVITDREVYQGENGPKLNYSSERIDEKELWILPHPLLFEKGMRTRDINCFEWEGNKVFFDTGGDLPFDIFAASFYLLSRYEEYLPHKRDIYGRYASEQSLASREGFLSLPLINIWIHRLRERLERGFPGYAFASSG